MIGQYTEDEILIHPIKKKIMIKYLVFAIVLFGYGSRAQTTFFIEPIVEKKIYISSMRIDKKFGFSNIENNNDYFSFRNKIMSSRSYDIPMGLVFGVSLNNSHILSFGFVQDGVGSKSRTTGLYRIPYDHYDNIATYAEFTSFAQSLHYANRYCIHYKYKINKNPNKFYINTSLSYLRVRKKHEFQNVITGDIASDNGVAFFRNDAILLQTEHGSYASGGTFMIGLGVSSDLGIKVKNKWRYLFSFSIDYKQGITNSLQNGYSNYFVKDKDKIFCFHYETQSRGSGIYFELSRRFQFYPWKTKTSS
jgi:hypothetical protein